MLEQENSAQEMDQAVIQQEDAGIQNSKPAPKKTNWVENAENFLKSKSSKLPQIIGIGVAVVVLIVLLIVFLKPASAEATAKKYIGAMLLGDIKTADRYCIFDLMEILEEDEGDDYDDIDAFIEDYQADMLDEMADQYGDDFQTSVTIKRVRELSERKTEDLLENWEDIEDSSAGDYLKADISDITKICEVSFEAEIEGSEDDASDEAEFYLAKIGRDWLVMDSSF